MSLTRREFVFVTGTALLGLSGCTGQTQEMGSNQVNEPATTDAVSEAEPIDLEVVESGFYFDSYGSAHFAAIVSNPNSSWAAENIHVTVAARDSDGNVVDTLEDYITLMFPDGQTAICGDMGAPESTASLEVTTSVSSSGWTKQDITQKDFYDQLPITNITESIDEWGETTVAGEIANNTEGAFSGTRIQVVFRNADGGIVGGAYTYVNGELAAGSTAPFSTLSQEVPEHASVEAYVDCGWPITE